MAMKTEQPSGVRQLDDYGSDHWVEVSNTSGHHSPLNEYSTFGFVTPLHIPLDSVHEHSQEPSYSTHRPYVWPSQLTSPSQGPPPPPMPSGRPLAPATSVSPGEPSKAATSASAPNPVPNPTNPNARKTLTDHDRRRMCQYHEDNPNVKQTEIGAMFGVERSTVSKVLRQKEKFLAADDGGQSPMKRAKGKFPDIERALSNWAKNHQKQGFSLNDDEIRDKARFFASTVGGDECRVKVNSVAWLEKFKQKNLLLGARPVRGAINSEDMDLGDDLPSNLKSESHTPSALSPVSPDGAEKQEHPDGYVDFSANYRQIHSESASSLASVYSETTVSTSFSPELRSPTYFSPDSSCGPSPLLPSQRSTLLAQRPGRQTFPATGFVPEPSGTPPLRYSQSTMAVPTLESSMEEMEDQDPLHIETAVHPSPQPPHPSSQPGTNHNTPILSPSPSSMAPPPQPPPSSSPPSQDEARRAMETVMAFFQNRPSLDPQEYMLIGKLMEKLKLQGGNLPGGMHTLDRNEAAMNIPRKRSIHSL